MGETASFGDYHPPDWGLAEAMWLRAVRATKVHDITGVAVEAQRWKPAMGWSRAGSLYARLTDDKAQYLAVCLEHEDHTQIESFLDPNFAWNWGEMDRALADRGRYSRAVDGSLTCADDAQPTEVAGVCSVSIGGRCFTCLRVLEGGFTDETSSLAVAYLTRDGRTVLVRHFCRREFVGHAEFEVVLDESHRLTINDVTLFHWYDTISGIAL